MNKERYIVAKFGGSSLASTERFICVGNIIDEDPRRKTIVVSAPGVDKDNPFKITDLLILCGRLSFMNFSSNNIFGIIERRFLAIADGLGVTIDEDLEAVKRDLLEKRQDKDLSIAWAASRGEWLSGKLLARYLGAEFVDAAEIMKFQDNGLFDHEVSYKLISQRLNNSERFVIPGFYGQDQQSRIRIFPRGGSDITGSIISAALGAQIYENWTDVDGVKTADPRIVPQAKTIPFLEYEKMEELSLSGAKVFHPAALSPVWREEIPVNVRNTFNSSHPGTWIGTPESYRDHLQTVLAEYAYALVPSI